MRHPTFVSVAYTWIIVFLCRGGVRWEEVGSPGRRQSLALRTCAVGFSRDAANFTGRVLGCIETKCRKKNVRLKALAEIYTMHSFALLSNQNLLLKNCQHFAKELLKKQKFC